MFDYGNSGDHIKGFVVKRQAFGVCLDQVDSFFDFALVDNRSKGDIDSTGLMEALAKT